MGYFIRNKKIYREVFSDFGRIHYEYVEEAPPITIFSLSLKIMSKYERNNNTDCRAYKYAQRVVCCKLVGIDTCSSFLRD